MNLGDDAEDGWNGAWVDRVAPADEAAPLPQLLARPAVDAIVSCAADSARCHERVTEARRQIGLAPRIVPLIVWRLDPTGPCGAHSVMHQLGADGVLDAPRVPAHILTMLELV
jgi:hypothetical protein